MKYDEIAFLTVEPINAIHLTAIVQRGGRLGVLNEGRLESVAMRCQQTFHPLTLLRDHHPLPCDPLSKNRVVEVASGGMSEDELAAIVMRIPIIAIHHDLCAHR